MPSDSGSSPFPPWWRSEFRFSLRGLLLFVVTLGVGLAVSEQSYMGWWPDGPLVA